MPVYDITWRQQSEKQLDSCSNKLKPRRLGGTIENKNTQSFTKPEAFIPFYLQLIIQHSGILSLFMFLFLFYTCFDYANKRFRKGVQAVLNSVFKNVITESASFPLKILRKDG
jgi:hypothetical protein